MNRRQPSNRDQAARRMFRQRGFDVEAVPMIRAQHEGEFMAIKCWPSTDVAEVVELLTQPANTSIHITRVHIGRETYPGSGKFQPRVFVAWNDVPQPRMTWEQIEAALANRPA